MSRQVLIIGGTRFLGLEITRAFSEERADIYTLNRGTNDPAPGLSGSFRCDKNDRKAFTKILQRQRWDVIVDTILDAEDLAFVVETLGSKVGHFIHTGSLGVYGDAQEIPATENLPLAEYAGDDCVVFNPKIQQDQVLLRAFSEQRFPMTILRCSYICGPGAILLDGWGGRSREFFQMLEAGAQILLPDNGKALLHPGDVRDLGRAFVHAAQCPESIGQVYNIGGSYAVMMKDYVSRMAKMIGSKSEIQFGTISEVLSRYPQITNERGMRFSCQHMCASITKARNQLAWQPKISLDQSLREAIDWMKKKPVG